MPSSSLSSYSPSSCSTSSFHSRIQHQSHQFSNQFSPSLHSCIAHQSHQFSPSLSLFSTCNLERSCASVSVARTHEDVIVKDVASNSTQNSDAKGSSLVPVQKKDSVIEKSLDKLKETSTDVLQGTQLLAIDTAAALELLRRVLIGDELMEKEKQALRRTLTDLASVFPIGFLMLLPVTAVGHAAMLAAIQRYVPSLIPSTYGPERLDLLRQLEKVKEMEGDVSVNENADDENNPQQKLS